MLQLEEARGRIFAAMPALASESVAPGAATGRILAEEVHAPIDLPPFDNSAMDGYAVRTEDLKNASAKVPVPLRLAGQSAAGAAFSGKVEPGSCARIFTGAPLPPGADAVVMQEDVIARGQEIAVSESAKPWENIRLQGEDVKRGSRLLASGEAVSVGGAGLLAALGVKAIRVSRQPVIGLISTGSELIEAGQPLEPGQIYESNRILLAPLLGQAGAISRIFPLAPDRLDATRGTIESAFKECDAVVTTGGVSVGEHDLVKQAFEAVGGTLQFWKVAIRPGKPFTFGVLPNKTGGEQKFLFGLPGNPVSALVTFLLLVRPALLKWQGAACVDLPTVPGILGEPLANRAERRHWIRVIVDADGNVFSAGLQASHALSSLAKANGLVEVPPQTTLAAGAKVQVLRWG